MNNTSSPPPSTNDLPCVVKHLVRYVVMHACMHTHNFVCLLSFPHARSWPKTLIDSFQF